MSSCNGHMLEKMVLLRPKRRNEKGKAASASTVKMQVSHPYIVVRTARSVKLGDISGWGPRAVPKTRSKRVREAGGNVSKVAHNCVPNRTHLCRYRVVSKTVTRSPDIGNGNCDLVFVLLSTTPMLQPAQQTLLELLSTVADKEPLL